MLRELTDELFSRNETRPRVNVSVGVGNRSGASASRRVRSR